MATVQEPKKRVRRSLDDHLTLFDVSWKEYTDLLRIMARRHLRITYDEGVLEIMTLSDEHEWTSRTWDLLIHHLALLLRQPIRGYGGMTFRRPRKRKGLAPDECYWIQNEAKVRGKRQIDLDEVFPPDLIVEIDITSSSIDRIAMYEKLGVPEVWHWGQKGFEVLLLDDKRHYTKKTKSLAFPGLTVADLLPFIDKADKEGETDGVLAFQDWVREQIKNNWPDARQSEVKESKKKNPKVRGSE
jgi:Uma2 family endonuclease